MKTKSNIIVLIVTILSAIFAIFTYGSFQSKQFKIDNRISNNNAKVQRLNLELSKIKASNKTLSFDGEYKSDDVLYNNELTKIAQRIDTYKSAKQYNANRKYVMSKISASDDKKFYKTVFPDDTDFSGSSVITALNLKSISSHVDVYKIKDGEYRVISSAIPYHKAGDLTSSASLSHTYSSFTVKHNIGKDGWTVVSVDKGFGV